MKNIFSLSRLKFYSILFISDILIFLGSVFLIKLLIQKAFLEGHQDAWVIVGGMFFLVLFRILYITIFVLTSVFVLIYEIKTSKQKKKYKFLVIAFYILLLFAGYFSVIFISTILQQMFNLP